MWSLGCKLTISLNRIVSDAAQHSELGMRSQPKSFPHPREEMRQTVMATPHALGHTRTPTRKRKRPNTIRPKRDIRVCISELTIPFKYLTRGAYFGTAKDDPIARYFERGDFDFNLEFC